MPARLSIDQQPIYLCLLLFPEAQLASASDVHEAYVLYVRCLYLDWPVSLRQWYVRQPKYHNAVAIIL